LAKLAPICNSSAPASAASAGPASNPPSANAQALPTSTGTLAALSVFGRAASSQLASAPGDCRCGCWTDAAALTGNA
jgi:hypothetical protein